MPAQRAVPGACSLPFPWRSQTEPADSVFVLGYNTVIHYHNTAAQRLLGFDHTELRGLNFECLLVSQDNSLKADLYRLQLNRKVQCKNKSGDTMTVLMSVGTGAISGAIMFMVVLRETVHNVEDATVPALFHELRNPLNRISCGVDYLLTSPENPLEELSSMARVMAYVVELMDNSLDMSKLLAKKLTLERNPFNLREECMAAYHAISHLLSPGIILLDSDIPDTLVLGSSRHLRQILINLLSNAAKYTKTGNLGLHVLVEKITTTEIHIQFQVADTGCGISSDDMDRLFAQYSQLERGQCGQKGTGLGLFLSQALVQLMGGKIEVASPWCEGLQPCQNGHQQSGTMFYFSLTLPLAHEGPSEEPELQTPLVSLPSNLRVLIADDDKINRELLIRIMTRQGAFKGLGWQILLGHSPKPKKRE
eukprot:NODE_246_length_2038_cov_132.742081_g212_i0.p1 GENE.NODE_246_length_2038_cov_132.742081_g212_i0~~NODE_246_length_2038_cov_132.742081_g212_i0.p1  ORF type:complete len:422 (+),score=91.84 NODE_246_length_2038_cov_132.742081_g212_i0:338-1603(+)